MSVADQRASRRRMRQRYKRKFVSVAEAIAKNRAAAMREQASRRKAKV